MRRTTIVLGGNWPAGKVRLTTAHFMPTAGWSLLSLKVGEVQNAPPEREGSMNRRSRKETEGFGGTSGYFTETQQDHWKSCLALFWRKCNRISISSWLNTREGNYLLTHIFFLENTSFSSNHIDVYLQESQVMLNASSSASRNLPGSTKTNGVAHISSNLASSRGVSSGLKPCFY